MTDTLHPANTPASGGDDICDFRPDLGAETREPSVRDILRSYYGCGLEDPKDALRFTDAYCDALAAIAAQPPKADGGVVPGDPLVAYLERQWSWSKETFGPALRTKGIVQHITKELREIEADPHDLAEWVDVIILAMDGFWRHGGKPADLLPAMQAKQDRNFSRTWPDWRTMGEDQAIEHDRSGEAAKTAPTEAGEDLAGLSAAATPGPWYVESEKSDGTYGAGEDCSEGYDVSTICTEAERPYGFPGVLFESHNSTVGLIEEETDEDSIHAWDAVSKANAEFVVALVNAYREGRLTPAASRPVEQGDPVAWAGLKLCPEEGSNDDLCSFPSCTCAYKRLPCPLPGTENIPVAIPYEDVVRRLYTALPDLTQDEAQCVAEAAFPELLRDGTTIAPAASESALDREKIAKALYEHDTPEPRFLWPIQNARMAAKYRSRADAILALLNRGANHDAHPAPAASRPAVGREAVREILGRLWCFAEGAAPDDAISDAGHTMLCATLGGLDPTITRRIDEHTDQILALLDPRDDTRATGDQAKGDGR